MTAFTDVSIETLTGNCGAESCAHLKKMLQGRNKFDWCMSGGGECTSPVTPDSRGRALLFPGVTESDRFGLLQLSRAVCFIQRVIAALLALPEAPRMHSENSSPKFP